MIKKLLFTLLIGITTFAYSQVPQEISYQGVARNTTGSVLPNQIIGIKLDLHQGSAAGTVVFSESHNKTTNAFGLFTLGIGSSNGTAFTAINWANGPYFLEVSMDPAGGTAYTSVGTQQFMSVPYALYAQTSGNAAPTPTITINAPNTVTSVAGSYSITVPAQTLSLNSNSLSISSGNTVILPTGTTYSAGNGIDITGGVISNTAVASSSTTVVSGNNITLNQSGSTYTVNAPSYSLAQTGNNIDLFQNGTSIGTATLPAVTSYSAGNGIDITGNTISVINPTITSTGIAVVTPTTGNTFNVDVPAPALGYNNATNVLSLTQGTTVTTATLVGTGTNTVSIVGSGLASVSPTTGSTFTVSVSSPTFTPNGPTTITGTYPNLTINSTASPSTTLVQGNNILLNNSGSTYTVSAPAYSISLPGGNTVQITNGVSTSSAAIATTSLTLTGTNNNILSAGGNTVGLNTYTAGTGIAISGTAPNYTLSSPNQSLTINSNSLSITGGNTITLPTSSIAGIGTGIATVTTSANNFTVNVPSPTYTAATGALGFGTSTINATPTLSLTGTTLTSGPATNSVNLTGFNGIYGGSGAIQTGSTTVSVGTNTLTFLSGATAGKPIANFFGGGLTGTHLAVGHIGANNATIKLLGSVSTTPVDYGYFSGSTNGIAISGGTSSNGLYATTNAEIGVGTYTTGTGKFVITHTASQANPTMHLRETTGALSRIKFSNTGVAGRYFEVGASNNALDIYSAYSVSFFDGTNYKSRFLIYGDGKTSINNMHAPLTTFHVMDDNSTSPGMAAEGFGFSGQLNLTRNNPLGSSPTYTRGSVFGGNEIGKINFAGYDGGTSSYGDGAKIYAKATENVTGATRGTELIFAAVPSGSSTNSDVFKINGNNKLEVITGLLIPSGAALGKILTSDALGNASWQVLTAPMSAWTSTLGATTLNNSGDKVGIGTNTPNSLLHVLNTGTIDGLNVDMNNGSGNGNAIQVNQKGTGYGMFLDVNNTAGADVFRLSTNGTGYVMNATKTSSIGGFASFNSTNANNSSTLLSLTNSGSGRLIEASNTSAINPTAYLSNSSGNAIEALSSNGRAILATAASSNAGIEVSNSSTGYGLLAENSSASVLNYAGYFNGGLVSKGKTTSPAGFAIRAVDASSVELFGVRNDGHVGINATSPAHRLTVVEPNNANAAIFGSNTSVTSNSLGVGISGLTSNTHSLAAAVLGQNTNAGPSIYGLKGSASTGIAGRFEIQNTASSADVIFAQTEGTGAAIHAVNGPTVSGSSNAAVWLESGHLKSTQAISPTVNTVSVSTSFSGATYTLTNATDIKGNLLAVCTTTSGLSVYSGSTVTFRVNFNKSYQINPTVIITPLNDMNDLSYYISGTNTTSFNITIRNSSAGTISVPSLSFGFNYMVIE